MATNLVPINENEPFSGEEITAFEERYNLACANLADAIRKRKALEEQERMFKELLGKAMDEYGIKSMENQYIKFTRIAETKGKSTLDVDALKREEPDLYAELINDYHKVTGARKAFVKFEVR